MKIITTPTFLNFLSKHIGLRKDGIQKLTKGIYEHNHKLINLKNPFCKLKIKIYGVAYRLVILVEGEYIIPILIYYKKDKKYGENIIRTKELSVLINFYIGGIQDDIAQNKHSIYPE